MLHSIKHFGETYSFSKILREISSRLEGKEHDCGGPSTALLGLSGNSRTGRDLTPINPGPSGGQSLL